MEAGYDYLLVRRRFHRHLVRYGAGFLVFLGVAALVGGISFFVIFDKSTEELQDKHNVSSVSTDNNGGGPQIPAGPLTPQGELARARESQQTTPVPTPTAQPSPSVPPTTQATSSPEASLTPEPIVVEPVRLSQSVISAARFYPGENLRAAHWANPLAFEPLSSVIPLLIEGFRSIDPGSIPAVGTLPNPTRLIIPSIDVDSEVDELKIFSLGDSRAYETPKNVVGHIPETARPGEKGSTWLFGHLESPIRNEGNVFAQLPKVPSLLRTWINGGKLPEEAVYVVVENGRTSFLYQITETKVVPQEELRLHDTGEPGLMMVTCVPRFIYDHRLIVSGELVGIKG